ncbi:MULTISPECIES: GNAT family N-acetyltransferase [Bacillus]|uniref:GNAT family N-acetyltransferase n=1 Tax=Bacillus TaxID=1386 RepID=UPI000BF9DC8F|nr:GNAT family N-acetyltransferase [Bacillus wiedmannii]MBJ8117424.1 GNAT family N-acetyltransferase [Bacillus cereus]RFB10870.1 N-acetyltransferase [Bacillus sp. OE]RFB24941.1 N-acetyltransferase [Bacillus sp. LB(2018)]PGC25494.1 N-acetyltransferase [Bacillus wiedmannii]PGW19424.1 N-acetyltransferase [Bacillus cereus]
MKEKFNEIPLHVQDFQKFKMLLEELVQDEVIFIEGLSKYSLNISSKEHKVTINLRSEFFLDPHLVITAISITPSNQGKGSIVLEWFKTFAKEKGFERLILQEVITEEGYNFALKNGFSKKVGPFEEIFRKPDSTDGNYELHL